MARSAPLLTLLVIACALAVIGYVTCNSASAAFVAPRALGPGESSPTSALRSGLQGASVGPELPGRQYSESSAGFVGRAALAALALALSAGAVARGARAGLAARRARVVTVEVENDVPLSLRAGSVAQMDAFMKENATEVSLQNLERIEDKPGEPDVKFCYLEATDFGPFRMQMRMTVRVSLPESGRCNVDILNMENGSVDKKTGVVTFPEPDENASNFKFDTSNAITWKDDGDGGLRLVNKCTAKSETVLPFWFPLPDALMQTLTSGFVRRIISGGQEKVMDQMKLKFTVWEKQAA